MIFSGIFYILMMAFLLLFFVAVFVVSAIRNFFRRPTNTHTHNRTTTFEEQPSQRKREKIFDKNDGEYVSFEEVEDDK